MSKAKGDALTKHCGSCKETLPISEFVVNTARSDSLSGYCRQCMGKSNLESTQRLRMRVLVYLGSQCANPGCAVPGGMKDPRALQVDHIEGNGRADRAIFGNNAAFLREVLRSPPGKYQLLCANCNTIRRVELGQHKGDRVYERTVPTKRTLLRDDPEWKQQFGQMMRNRWAAVGPEALAERNRKISESRTGKNRALTDEQEAEAIRLMREGGTQTAVAKMFGVSGPFMNKLAKREGIAFQRGNKVGVGRALTSEQEAEVLSRLSRGEMGTAIAESFGVSKDLIYKIAKRDGVLGPSSNCDI